MSELEAMNLRELRQLASEHHVTNRSRLAKQDLIQALASVVQKQGEKKQETANKQPDKKGVDKKPSPTKKAAAKKSPAKKIAVKKVAAKNIQEPEVLDAAAVAGITAAVTPVKAKTPAKRRPAQDKENTVESKAAAVPNERVARPKSTDDTPALSPQAEAVATDESPASGEEGRSRGRRRRRGSRNQGSERDRNGENRNPQNQTPNNTTTVKTDTASSKRHEQSTISNTDNKNSDNKDSQQQNRTPRRSNSTNSNRREQRVPKPRLENNQRSTPPILNRLKDLACGILELCDPETPSWAQARLSELLAESGVYPTPCTGKPHSDFHDIIGSIKSENVEDGHIALIEAPGFSLRGDRGDLFALRKAKVRVAGDSYVQTPSPQVTTTQAPALTQTPTSTQAPAAQTTTTEKSNISAPRTDSASPAATSTAVTPNIKTSNTTASTNTTATQTDEKSSAPVTVTAKAEENKDETPSEGRTPGRSRRSRGGRSRSQGDDSSAGEQSADRSAKQSIAKTDSKPAYESDALIDDAQKKIKAPRKATRATKAEALPLKTQSEDELKERGASAGFTPLGLHPQILADLHSMGFEDPSPIQEQCIPIAIANKDVIGQAQTGTGKTAAFVLPILHKLYEWDGKGPVALICCPTRELAKQVYSEFTRMAGQSAARAALIYGGVSMNDQFDALSNEPHVIIGTPGRLIDHIKRHTLDLSRLKMLVLDEADQMLDIGFLPDIEFIFKHSPPKRQCMLFSATMAPEIKRLCENYQNDPQHIHIAPEMATAESVDQKFIAVDRPKKNDLLAHFIETHNPEQLMVFCKTKAQTDRVAQVLRRKNMKAAAIHGDLPQSKRERTLQDFRSGTLNCLIATNVAARGLDIPSISHVVNYDIPENPEEYVHRIGRTGRMGAKGVARTFITADDGQFLVEIEKLIGFELEEEMIEGFKATTAKAVTRSIADTPTNAPRLLKPIIGGIRLGRRRRK